MKNDNRLPSHLIEVIRHLSHSTSLSLRPPLLWLAILSLTILLLARTGLGDPANTRYPRPVEVYVNDFAMILTAEHEATIRTVLTELRREADIHVVVVTVQSIRSYKTSDQSIESFATNLFNSWGIGDKQRNDGVLILVAVKDRKVRIEVGSGYGNQLNRPMQDVIRDQMLPHFKTGNYSLGVLEGTNAVVRTLSERKSTTTLPMTPVPAT